MPTNIGFIDSVKSPTIKIIGPITINKATPSEFVIFILTCM